MSGKAMGRVWELKLPRQQTYILLAMADHADHDGENIYPGVELIAWKTGYSERQVQRIIHQLVQAKILLVVEERPGDTTRYRINWEAAPTKAPRRRGRIWRDAYPRQDVTPDMVTPPEPTPADQNVTPGGDVLTPADGQNVTPGGDSQMSPEPSIKPSLNRSDQPSEIGGAVVEPDLVDWRQLRSALGLTRKQAEQVISLHPHFTTRELSTCQSFLRTCGKRNPLGFLWAEYLEYGEIPDPQDLLAQPDPQAATRAELIAAATPGSVRPESNPHARYLQAARCPHGVVGYCIMCREHPSPDHGGSS